MAGLSQLFDAGGLVLGGSSWRGSVGEGFKERRFTLRFMVTVSLRSTLMKRLFGFITRDEWTLRVGKTNLPTKLLLSFGVMLKRTFLWASLLPRGCLVIFDSRLRLVVFLLRRDACIFLFSLRFIVTFAFAMGSSFVAFALDGSWSSSSWK